MDRRARFSKGLENSTVDGTEELEPIYHHDAAGSVPLKTEFRTIESSRGVEPPHAA
jgi:hypothetical protein